MEVRHIEKDAESGGIQLLEKGGRYFVAIPTGDGPLNVYYQGSLEQCKMVAVTLESMGEPLYSLYYE